MSTNTAYLVSTQPNDLRDYKLHLSTSEPQEPGAAEREIQGRLEVLSAVNPPTWPTNYRRVPRYRPINRHQDPEQRPNGANTAEFVFITVMLNGVRTQAMLVTLYERTAGKIFPSLTRYKIGGEW